MKKVGIYFLALGILSSCGSQDPKSELQSLKDQKAKIESRIAELEKLTALEDTTKGKMVLVSVNSVIADVFKTYIEVQGKVDADENVNLSSEMPGTVTKINVKPGQEVSVGQVLAETDARVIQQSISDLQTNLDLVTQLYEKQKNLWDQKIGTEVQLMQAKTNKESLEKKMSTLQEQLRMTKIISPINGTVDAVDIKLGQAVAPGIPAIRVINFNNLKVKADLSEAYSNRVKKGNQVQVFFPDMQDSLITKVNFTARAINPMSRTFSIEILLDNKKEYHPNMITKLKINDYVSAKPIITLPVKLIQTSGPEKFVFITDGKKAIKKMIKTGREYSGQVEILEGLTIGDQLICEGQEGLNDGDGISIKK